MHVTCLSASGNRAIFLERGCVIDLEIQETKESRAANKDERGWILDVHFTRTDDPPATTSILYAEDRRSLAQNFVSCLEFFCEGGSIVMFLRGSSVMEEKGSHVGLGSHQEG